MERLAKWAAGETRRRIFVFVANVKAGVVKRHTDEEGWGLNG